MEGESAVTRSIIDELHFRISNEIKRKVKVVSGSIIDEFHSWHLQGDQTDDVSGVTLSIIDELHSSDIERDEMESENDVTRSINDELPSLDIQAAQI